MNIEKIVYTLKEFGFTEYEAKVYLALLEENNLNGNSIALKSGVPGPKVYETLRKMTEKGFVFVVSDGSNKRNKRYSPLPYKDLLNSFEKALTKNIELLNDSFEALEAKDNANWTELFHISGYETSINVVIQAIKRSTDEIILSCWSKELEKLKESLLEAHNRGVKVVTIIFDQSKIEYKLPWRSFRHYDFPSNQQRHNGELSCVIDVKKVIVLDSLQQDPHAVVSSHQAMVKTTRNYIRHDIYVNRIMQDFSKEMMEKYGEGAEKLIGDF